MIDLEATISDVLRASPVIQARVADRCWLTMPAKPTFPALMIRRVSGAPEPTWQGPMVFDSAQLDIHAYGGSRVEALGLLMDALEVLGRATNMIGLDAIAILRIPDPDVPQDSGRDRERYIGTVRAWGRMNSYLKG